MRNFLFVTLLAIINSCGSPKSTFSDDFYVIWDSDAVDSFDLKNMRFQRNYIERDTVIPLTLTTVQLKRIYDILVNNKVSELESEDFSSKCSSSSIPSFTDRLVINYANRKTQFVWDGSYNDCKDEDSRWNTFYLDRALSEIKDIVYNLPEVAELEETDLVFH